MGVIISNLPLQGHAGLTSAAQPVTVGEQLAQSSSDKITKAHELKEDGNAAFKAGNYRTAMKKYHHALMYTKGVINQGDLSVIPGLEHVARDGVTDEEKAAATKLDLIISNNLAGSRHVQLHLLIHLFEKSILLPLWILACFLSIEKWEKALEYTNKVSLATAY